MDHGDPSALRQNCDRDTLHTEGRYNWLRGRNMKAWVVGLAAMFAAACGTSSTGYPASVGGPYMGPVTNGPNSCPGIMWNTGMMNIAMVTIEQTGPNITIQLNGPASPLLMARFGTNSFAGAVSGTHMAATIIGTVQVTSGGCVYTSNGDLAADLGGDILTGNIIYTPQTNGHLDCTTMRVTGCSSKQTFGFNRQF
jgi:hypothetical protein